MPPELSAALSAVALAVAIFLGYLVKRMIKNGKSVPPPPRAPLSSSSGIDVADTGQHQSIVALMSDQVAIHTQPIAQRLDKIETNQQTQSKSIGKLGERIAGVEATLIERARKSRAS